MNTMRKICLFALASTLPTHALAEWSGAYAGISFGHNLTNEQSIDDGGISLSVEAESSNSLGVFGGYQAQNGDFVFGGEVAILRAPDLEFRFGDLVSNTNFDILDLKGRAGYSVDNILLLGIAGFSRISANDDNANGFNFGIGVDYDFGNNFVVGAEYLMRRATHDDVVDVDINLDTIALRAAFKF